MSDRRDADRDCSAGKIDQQSKTIDLWGHEAEVILTLSNPRIAPEFITSDGRLDVEKYRAACSG